MIVDRVAVVLGTRLQYKIAAPQNFTVGTAEKGNEHFTGRCRRVEINVKEIGETAVLSVFQQVQPKRIVFAADRHVIGHDIDDEAEARSVQRIYQRGQTFFAAEFGIDVAEIDDVIAVHRASPRRQDRRGIDMGNAEVAQISGDGCAVLKGEVLVKLQTVCRGEIGIEFAERPHLFANPRGDHRSGNAYCERSFRMSSRPTPRNACHSRERESSGPRRDRRDFQRIETRTGVGAARDGHGQPYAHLVSGVRGNDKRCVMTATPSPRPAPRRRCADCWCRQMSRRARPPPPARARQRPRTPR
jgi:hypothetical protein